LNGLDVLVRTRQLQGSGQAHVATASTGAAAKLVIHAASKKVHVATARWRSRPRVDIVSSHFQRAAVGNSSVLSSARTTAHRAYRRREFSSKRRSADDDQIPESWPQIPDDIPEHDGRRSEAWLSIPENFPVRDPRGRLPSDRSSATLVQAKVPENRSTMARRMTGKQSTEVGPAPASDKRRGRVRFNQAGVRAGPRSRRAAARQPFDLLRCRRDQAAAATAS
jgi:hypothetical protein